MPFDVYSKAGANAAFATAAQGALADTATQPGDLGTAATTDATAYAASGTTMHTVRKNAVRRAKGGVLGTSGKGVVAWRVDHQLDQHRTTTWPILRDRGMPCGLGVVTDAVGVPDHPADPTATTWAQVRTMHWEGCEIWSHSATHLDPSPLGAGETLAAEIVGSRETLHSNGLVPMGWQMPGITGCQTPDYSANFTSTEQFATPTGQALLGAYGLLEFGQQIPGGQPRNLPTDGVYGYAHTVTIESATLAQCKGWVDYAVDLGVGVELMFHPRYVGMSGMMTLADFTALADYVKAKWDAGSIEVLTPSGLAFADPGSARRLQLVQGSSFEALAFSGLALGKWTANNTTGITVGADGGRTGNNYLRFAATSGANFVHQGYNFAASAGIAGAAFVAEAWVRQPDGVGSATARVYVMDNSGNNPLFIRDVRVTLTPGQGWTRIRVPFCIPQTSTQPLVRISRFPDANIGNLDFDDVTVTAI